MFKKVLIANRGEIALRVIRACREMGIATVAVHSTADANALHVRFADEAVCIGPPSSKESYLNVPALLSAAEITRADAIHPGYGFLSENAEFAEVCQKCQISFIGPRPEVIRLMGNKVRAREAAKAAGLPLLPGSPGVLKSAEEAVTVAESIGYPVILKAAAGGGGRGMKIVRESRALPQAFATASAEAVNAFSNGDMYLERYVERPRHIEIQIVGDLHGNIVHLGERECSVQRRHQKLIEESPSPGVSPRLREEMGRVSVEAMKLAGLPLLPGSEGVLKSDKEAEELAEVVGFPVILKAAAGGGGRGMKIVREKGAVRQAYNTASAEAVAAFGNGDMYLERYVEKPRHIELQVVADEFGEVIILGERECSVQRRHQKLVEEAPSPGVSEELRARMIKTATEAMKKIRYNNVGTIEFLMDEHGEFYFMEMNTRIQVEHPVTELVTGIDLVQEMIRLAAGEPLGRTQKQVKLTGHAIECRINAEDPVTFAPSPGTITAYNVPGGPGVRVDSFVYEQYRVLPFYDSLVGKLIVSADTREQAIRRMRRALFECIIEGIKTNIPFQRLVMNNVDFVAGKYDTRLVEQILSSSHGPKVRAAIEATP